MCFPSKKTKAAFDDDKPSARPSSKDIKQAPTTPTPAAMSSPKIAIIIYTLYGHIAKRTSSP